MQLDNHHRMRGRTLYSSVCPDSRLIFSQYQYVQPQLCPSMDRHNIYDVLQDRQVCTHMIYECAVIHKLTEKVHRTQACS